MPPSPARTPAATAPPRSDAVRAVTPDLITAPPASPALTPAAPVAPPSSRAAPPTSRAVTSATFVVPPPPRDTMPPPPALMPDATPRGVKRPRASDDGSTSARKRARPVASRAVTTTHDRFVGSRLDDVGEAYRAHTALALTPNPGGAQPVLNASLRSSLLTPRRTGTRFLSIGSGRASTPRFDTAAARSLAVARVASSRTADRWHSMKPWTILDAPDVFQDFYCNLLDWSPEGGRIAIGCGGLGKSVYIYPLEGTRGDLTNLLFDEQVTSCAWAPGGKHVAVGGITGFLHVIDVETGAQVRTLDNVHDARVGVLHWNPVTRCLTSGSRTSLIVDSDLRCPSVVNTWRLGHSATVCGLKWRDDGQFLASGGDDDKLLVWDRRRAQEPCRSMAHRAAVKAIAWCPTRPDLLASGAVTADKRVRIWNTVTGASVASCGTGGQVTGLT